MGEQIPHLQTEKCFLRRTCRRKKQIKLALPPRAANSARLFRQSQETGFGPSLGSILNVGARLTPGPIVTDVEADGYPNCQKMQFGTPAQKTQKEVRTDERRTSFFADELKFGLCGFRLSAPAALQVRFIGLAPEGADAVGCRELPFPDTVSDRFCPHQRHGAKHLPEVRQQRSAGGGTQLAPDLAAIARNALQKMDRSRCGYRHQAMGTPYLPAANMDRRDGDKIRLQQIQGIAHAGYVGNGIYKLPNCSLECLLRKHKTAVISIFRGMGITAVSFRRTERLYSV